MMEMDSNPITKPSKKGTILSAVFYALAVVLLLTAFVSLAACHQNISRQLEQGVPVQGNELAIVNLYLTSCVQYFAFAAAMVFCGVGIPGKGRISKKDTPAGLQSSKPSAMTRERELTPLRCNVIRYIWIQMRRI